VHDFGPPAPLLTDFRREEEGARGEDFVSANLTKQMRFSMGKKNL